MEELPAAEFHAQDWPGWRGPIGDGMAPPGPAPVQWGESNNVVWKTRLPGRGQSSPTIIGSRIFLTTADEAEKVQSVVCYDRDSGSQVWKKKVHEENFPSGLHAESSHASCSVASDGRRLFALFLNNDAIWLTALDLSGQRLWQTNVGPYKCSFGYGSSPVVYKSLVIVAADDEDGGFVAGVHRKSGKIAWRKKRPAADSYCSPSIAHLAGMDQLLLSGGKQVMSYNPANGEKRWSCAGAADLTVATMVHDGDLVFAYGGWPQIHTVCVRADGSGEAVWENNTKIYTSSPLAHGGYLYGVKDDGIAYCWKAATGEQMWRKRLGGQVRSSLVLAAGNIYVSNTKGTTFVFAADPKKFTKLAENTLGNEAFSTPSFSGGRIYLRVGRGEGGSSGQWLYCVGE